MSNRNTVSTFAVWLVAMVVSGCNTAPTVRMPTDFEFHEIQMGTLTIQGKRTVVVRDDNELASLWKEGSLSGGSLMPSIDFTKYMLIGVFLGEYPVIERPQLYFRSVKRHYDRDRVEATYVIKDYKPPFGPRFTIYSQGSAHKLLLIPRSDLPVEFVELTEK